MSRIPRDSLIRALRAALPEGSLIDEEELIGGRIGQPVLWNVALPSGRRRWFCVYVWTITHGGATRSPSEYRIQMSLRERVVSVPRGSTTLTMGVYDSEGGSNHVTVDEEPIRVIVAWDAIRRLQPGASASCQVSYQTMRYAHIHGFAVQRRRIASGEEEAVIAFRPERFIDYLNAAAGGHGHIDLQLLT
jgi:hypothetical protein